MKIWIDIKNSHEPLFFKSIMKHFNQYSYQVTTRDFAEVVSLLERYKIRHDVIGKRPEGFILKRHLGFLARTLHLLVGVPEYDIAMNHNSVWSICAAKMRKKKIIVFNDNDINPIFSKYMSFVDHLISPISIDKNYYKKIGIKDNSLVQFDGFKEDIYIADYKPDDKFLEELPFKDFVAIRPENLQAMYIASNKESIVPEILKLLESENINVLFLPRYESDRNYARGFNNVFVPKKGLNGLDICYYSRAVLTGAGTFSREAGSMGRTAVSFFAGEKLLSVDKQMFRKGLVFHSRNPRKIVDYILSRGDNPINFQRSKMVQKDLFSSLEKILTSGT